MRRLLALSAAALLLGGGAVCVLGYRNAIRPPIVRTLSVRVADYSAKAPPFRIVFFSDLHVHGPDMPPARVARVVEQINALHPDIVVAAGDFVGDNWFGRSYSITDAIAPLAHLRARLGVYAVLGNNDYDAGADEVVHALNVAGIHVLVDDAVSVGPVALGGIDGGIYRPAEWKRVRERTDDALAQTPGMKLLAAHRPDEFPLAPGWITLVLAGHTHCGQIVLPLFGALATGSDHGRRYICGVVREGSKTLVVTGGLGTSHVPLRIGAPPDMWLITIQGT